MSPLLRDIFDLFIESHNSKQFLKRNEFVDDLQKRQIRHSLLKVCAVSGPDSEIAPSGKATSKFLDLAKITLDEYVLDGI